MGCGCNATAEQSGCGCSVSELAPVACPKCGDRGRNVTALTMRSQLRKETLEHYRDRLDAFNFCTNPSCSNVYYDDTQSVVISQKEVKSKVTLKNDDPDTPLCYCKKLLKADFFAMLENNEPDIAEKIKKIIASEKSFCEKSNPKGVCCTEDVKIFLKMHGIDWDEGDAPATSTGCC